MPDNDYGELKTARHARALGRTHRKREAPMKACVCCHTLQPNGQRVCHECGHEHFAKRPYIASPFHNVPNDQRKPSKDSRYKP